VTETTKLKQEEMDETSGAQTNGAAPDVEVDELAKATSERDGYLDQLQRTLAEFANYRRRVDQERVQAREFATRDLLRQLLPIVDDMRRGLAATPEEQQDTPWFQGITLIEKKLQGLLERENVTLIDEIGVPFDPAVHEAVASDPGSSGDTVVEIYQSGYRQKNNLLRPAMVRVGDKTKLDA
jgi:molecular chaperone GrpE